MSTGKWGVQIFAKGAQDAGDPIWVARYLLERTAEKTELGINWHCLQAGFGRLERLRYARQLLQLAAAQYRQ